MNRRAGMSIRTAPEELRVRAYIASAIKSAREHKGWSQETLGARVLPETSYHCRLSMISRWECGHVVPSVYNLYRLSRALEQPMSAFFPFSEQS